MVKVGRLHRWMIVVGNAMQDEQWMVRVCREVRSDDKMSRREWSG